MTHLEIIPYPSSAPALPRSRQRRYLHSGQLSKGRTFQASACVQAPGNWDSGGQYLQHLAPSWHPGALFGHATLAENGTAKPQGAFPLCQGKWGNVHLAAVKGVIRNRDWGLRREHWAEDPICVPATAPTAHTVSVTQSFTHPIIHFSISC